MFVPRQVMLQGDAKICCFLDVIDGVFVEFVCVWLPLLLPVDGQFDCKIITLNREMREEHK